MAPYLLVAAAILLAGALSPHRKPHPVAWFVAWLGLTLFVGLRHKVGMDWNNYQLMALFVDAGSLWESFHYAEPGFAALLWFSQRLGVGVYGANLVGSAIFCFGLCRFARTAPLPWLALAVAVPFLVIVVAMSANRQAIAIGILLWLCAEWDAKSIWKRVAFILAAALFHYSAICFLCFAALGLELSRPRKMAVYAGTILGAAVFLTYSGGFNYYDSMYVSGRSAATDSPGAVQHVLLNGLPAILLFLGRRQREQLFPSPLLRQMAVVALLLVPTAFVFSAAAGRLTLYLFPVSMMALSTLPQMFQDITVRAITRTAEASVLFGVLFVWLSFANSNTAHLPYRNALTVAPGELHIVRGVSNVTHRLDRRRLRGSRGGGSQR